MKKSYVHYFPILAVCCSCIIFTCLILAVTGTITTSISGFGVDNCNRLYIGTQTEIQVFEDGEIINRIPTPTSRAYVFTIQGGNSIVLSTSTNIYVMDLNGEILETEEDPGADMYNQISYRKRKFVSTNGDVYRLSQMLGRTKIIKNNSDVVYQIDGASLVAKIVLAMCFIVMFVYLFRMLSAQSRNRSVD